MTMPEPTSDIWDICEVFNDAGDKLKLGDSILPYAERVKAIVIGALAAEAEARCNHPHASDYQAERWSDTSVWLRGHLGDTEAT